MKKKHKLKQFPHYESDEDAERFVAEADLSEYDFSNFKPHRFELKKKEKQITMRMPTEQLETVKNLAAQRKIPYQRFIRDLINRGLQTL